jgi:cell wall-associated NlpC family hydrolase
VADGGIAVSYEMGELDQIPLGGSALAAGRAPGPAVPVSQLAPGDLLFYHTDPTAPGYISHVAIYLGNGWMIQAPQPGMDVEVVPTGFGAEFAGAVRVSPAQAAAAAAGLA